MSREPQDDAWLRRMLEQSPPALPEACLDAETLAAWADGGLTGQAAAAAELHASNCARCLTILASMERSAPPAAAGSEWTRARLLRWLVPLTAAATALAIWVAVPDRPITPERTAVLRQDQVPVPEAPVPEARVQEPPPQPASPSPERRELKQNAERLEAPSAGPVQAPAPPFAPQPEAAADAIAGTAMARARTAAQTFSAVQGAEESAAPGNPQFRWRVVASTSIERSTDGGVTWMSVAPMAGDPLANAAVALVTVRAVDAQRAVVRTSDGREFYTANGGVSWTPVQENSKAPF